MDDELPSLSRAAGKHRPEDRNIQPSLQWSKGHLHVRRPRHLRRLYPTGPLLRLLLQARTPSSGLLGAIIPGELGGIHGDHAAYASREHALPLTLTDLLAVVGPGNGLGGPFLLEEGLVRGRGIPEAAEVIQVIFAP